MRSVSFIPSPLTVITLGTFKSSTSMLCSIKNEYGKAYIILENSIVKMFYETYNTGIFILKSGKRIIEGNFIILN